MPAYFVLTLIEMDSKPGEKQSFDSVLHIIPVIREDGSVYYECYGKRDHKMHYQYAYTYEYDKMEEMVNFIKITFNHYYYSSKIECHSVYFDENEPLDYSTITSRIIRSNELWAYDNMKLRNSFVRKCLKMIVNA